MERFFSLSGLLVLVMVSGCANYSSSHEYYKERPEAKLEVPPGLDRPIEKMDMAIPDGKQTSTTYSSFRGGCREPEDKTELQIVQLEDLKVKREGGFIWLQADASPHSLWHPVQAFLKENEYSLARQDDELGIIETRWLVSRQDDIEQRSKYRLRFEFGANPSSSEIYLSLRQQSKLSNGWQRTEADHEQEIEMLKRLALYLGDSEVEFQQQTAVETEVVLTEQGDSGGISITLNYGFDEAWRRTIQAIENSGDNVEERSINQRFLLARFEDHSSAAKSRNQSWMGKILTPSDKHDAGRFRIEFFGAGDGHTTLQIQDLQGQVTNSERAKQIMMQLEQTLAEQ